MLLRKVTCPFQVFSVFSKTFRLVNGLKGYQLFVWRDRPGKGTRTTFSRTITPNK